MNEPRMNGRVEDSGEVITIAAARIERLISVIAMASTVDVDQAMALLNVDIPDALGVVEEGFVMFLAELRDARRATEEVVEQLTRSKQEIEQKLRTIEQQRGEIEELSAPIIDLWEGILALPLVGQVDVDRITRITEALLHRVVATRTRWVIIDLTGVGGVDETTAGSLIQLTAAAELIGARCIMTGIRPSIVDALLAFGSPTGRLQPRRTLQEGLRYCVAADEARARARR